MISPKLHDISPIFLLISSPLWTASRWWLFSVVRQKIASAAQVFFKYHGTDFLKLCNTCMQEIVHSSNCKLNIIAMLCEFLRLVYFQLPKEENQQCLANFLNISGKTNYCKPRFSIFATPSVLNQQNLRTKILGNLVLLKFPETEFLDINFTKDSSLLLQAIHSPFYSRILKKTILFLGFKNPYEKICETRKLESIDE